MDVSVMRVFRILESLVLSAGEKKEGMIDPRCIMG